MSSHRFFLVSLVSFVALGAAACKQPAPKDKPETLARLTDCEERAAKLADKDKLIATYEAEITRLKTEGGTGGEFVFVIQGDALVIKNRPGGGGGAPIDDKLAGELSQKFIDVVNKSRGSIQKCYEQALKKNTGLQARSISLTVSANFSAAGAYTRGSFSPQLGDAFDGCMKGVATKWKLPAATQGMSFQATVSLSPS
jgi:predicted Rdx family selenoprotein